MLTDQKEVIEPFIKSKMGEHGVGHMTFKWSRMKRALGKFKPRQNVVQLSEPVFIGLGMPELVEHGVEENLLEDVILHEIAHAIEWDKYGTGGHGRRWKRIAREVGADPTRLAHMPPSAEELIAPYYRECENCGKTLEYLYRRPGSSARDRYCIECHDEEGVDMRECKAVLHDNPNQIL